jgi:WD40 repeat protein
MTLKGHSSRVNSVAFSPDGTRILTGSDDDTAKLWDPSTGRELITLKGHSEGVASAAFSLDGTRILTGGFDGTAKLWDPSTGREPITLKGHSEPVNSVAFSPDGTRILTGGFDGTAKLWDPSTGRELITLKGDRTGRHEQLTSVAFSPDGTRIFTGCANGTAKLWDPSTGRELISLNNTQGLWSVAFSPDGTRILTGSVDGTAQLWDASTGRELMTLKGHSETVDSVAFSPGGSRILTKSDDGTAKLWDASTGRELITLKRHSPFNLENSKGRNIRIIAFSPNEKRIVSGFADGHVEFWDIARGREVFDLEAILERSEMRGAAFSPDSKLVYLSDENEKTLAWDTETGQPAPATNPPAKFEMDSVLSPDGRFLAKRMGGKFVLIPQNEPLTGAEPWPLPNRDERLKYHGEQAAASEKSGQWFAAAFHLKRMLTDDSENADLKKRLEAALAQEPNKSGPSAPESANAPDPGQ